MWRLQIKFFRDNLRVIAPALPGFGKSSDINSYDSTEYMAKQY
tara:strand:+ start:274 stop:402 length:129 start_codon:yes stop_codon:yes gene_type:complete